MYAGKSQLGPIPSAGDGKLRIQKNGSIYSVTESLWDKEKNAL